MAIGVFRDGRYCKSVFIGKRTVKAGECAAVWSLDGKLSQVEGPKRVWMWCSTVRFLDRFSVDEFGYLRLRYKSGVVEHIAGPATIFLNPAVHETIESRDALRLRPGEAAVIYGKHAGGVPAGVGDDHRDDVVADAGGDVGTKAAFLLRKGQQFHASSVSVSRRVVHGPAVLMPAAMEWMEEFDWLAADDVSTAVDSRRAEAPKNKSKQQEPSSCNKHRLTPLRQWMSPVTVRGATTIDGSSANVTLSVCLRIDDIDLFLNSCADLATAVNSALCADVASLAAKMSLLELKEAAPRFVCAESLASMLPILVQCAKVRGAAVAEIAFRGLDNVVESARSAEAYKARAYMDEKEAELAERSRQIESLQKRSAAVEREIELAELERSTASELRRESEKEVARLKAEDARHTQMVRHADDTRRLEIERLAALHGLGVDLTALLIAELKAKATPAQQPPQTATSNQLANVQSNQPARLPDHSGSRPDKVKSENPNNICVK